MQAWRITASRCLERRSPPARHRRWPKGVLAGAVLGESAARRRRPVALPPFHSGRRPLVTGHGLEAKHFRRRWCHRLPAFRYWRLQAALGSTKTPITPAISASPGQMLNLGEGSMPWVQSPLRFEKSQELASGCLTLKPLQR